MQQDSGQPIQRCPRQLLDAGGVGEQVQVTIGGMAATVAYAGLVESGTYQLNVTVPNLPNGDAPIVATIGGVISQTGVSITVQQ